MPQPSLHPQRSPCALLSSVSVGLDVPTAVAPMGGGRYVVSLGRTEQSSSPGSI